MLTPLAGAVAPGARMRPRMAMLLAALSVIAGSMASIFCLVPRMPTG